MVMSSPVLCITVAATIGLGPSLARAAPVSTIGGEGAI